MWKVSDLKVCPYCGSEDWYSISGVMPFRCNSCGERFDKPVPEGYLAPVIDLNQYRNMGTTQYPEEWHTNPDLYYESRVSAGLGIPANYTPADPYDIQGKMPLINAMQVEWWDMPPEQAKQVLINAFRATMLSPRMNLKSNAILYQSLMDIPAEESNPDVFEQRIRELKSKWDAAGQTDLFMQDPEAETIDPNEMVPGRFMPGFWGNIRRLANLGPYADDIYEAAMDDIRHGGTGQIFRDRILNLHIPGVAAKVASFAWLALAPNTSELATLDVHMMRHLNQEGDAPSNLKHYLQLEDQLRNERDETYDTEVPLSHYQWAVWDARRTPGYHQDHTPLRAYDPTPFTEVHWPPSARPPRIRQPIVPENQMSLLGKWTKIPRWQMIVISSGSYTIQGKIVAGVPGVRAQGIAVRPDRQSKDEIEGIIASLSTHEQDYQRQKELIPEWAPSMNRGGKTAADFVLGPGGRGVTYQPSVICVSQWVDVNDNWLLENPYCRGIVAEKGGAASHGVVVARARNIAIVVDVPEAAAITPGDHLLLESENAIIYVNGGNTEEFGQAQEAEIPIIAWVWSKGNNMSAPIPPGEAGEAMHQPMIMQLYREGKWDINDSALGVIYGDGRVQMIDKGLSDEDHLITWLNTLHPISHVERGFGG